MSLHLEFEPHSWFMDFAIKNDTEKPVWHETPAPDWYKWHAYTGNGNTYQVDELYANTFDALKSKIKLYHLKHHNGHGERIAEKRLKYLRNEIEHERISYGEIAELQLLRPYIDASDTVLMEWIA